VDPVLSYPELAERATTLYRWVETPIHGVVETAGGAGTTRSRARVLELRFGGPLAIPLRASDVAKHDPLAAFIAAEASRWRYTLVHASISFPVDAGWPRLETARLQYSLSEDRDEQSVVAWSLWPAIRSSEYETETELAVGPSVKLHGADLTLGGYRHAQRRLSKDVFLLAAGELTNMPEWQFRRRRGQSLHGSQRLVMIVRSALGAKVILRVKIDGKLRQRRLTKRRIDLEGPPASSYQF
jgi:hypothetical protein